MQARTRGLAAWGAGCAAADRALSPLARPPPPRRNGPLRAVIAGFRLVGVGVGWRVGWGDGGRERSTAPRLGLKMLGCVAQVLAKPQVSGPMGAVGLDRLGHGIVAGVAIAAADSVAEQV